MARKPKWDNLVPFDEKGNMLSYIAKDLPEEEKEKITWVEKYEFEDTFEILDFAKGSSSIQLVFKSQTTDKLFSMFQKDLINLLKTATISEGKVSGNWAFQKRGVCHGIIMVPKPEDEEEDLI